VTLRRASLAAAVLLGVVAAGCGSSGSPSPQAVAVERTVSASLADLARSDGHAFCALMTAAGRRSLARTLHGYTCAALMAMVAEHMSPEQRAALGHVRVSGVSVHGDVALVSAADLHSPGEALDGIFSPRSAPTKLIRISDNTWRIAA
jgi:hypothetical protein